MRIKISSALIAFFPASFHSYIEVCDFLRELPLDRSFLDVACAEIQRLFQALNLFQEFYLFRNNVCALQKGICTAALRNSFRRRIRMV